VNGTTLERPDVAAYLDAVRSRLADLPAEERDDLVADVEASLLESGEPPTLPPEAFAAELREAAGLAPASPKAVQQSFRDSLRRWLSSERPSAWLRTVRELAPIWWLARAYVAVALVALAFGWGWPLGSGRTSSTLSVETSALALLMSTGASVWLGLRGRHQEAGFPRIRLAVNLALALALVPVAAHSLDQVGYYGYSSSFAYYEPTHGLAVDGTPIHNLYPYDRDGKPLFDVLLYDENGVPVDIGSGENDISRRILTGEDGTELYNSFPIRYFEPGTTTVAQPELGPVVTVPVIQTPELERP